MLQWLGAWGSWERLPVDARPGSAVRTRVRMPLLRSDGAGAGGTVLVGGQPGPGSRRSGGALPCCLLPAACASGGALPCCLLPAACASGGALPRIEVVGADASAPLAPDFNAWRTERPAPERMQPTVEAHLNDFEHADVKRDRRLDFGEFRALVSENEKGPHDEAELWCRFAALDTVPLPAVTHRYHLPLPTVAGPASPRSTPTAPAASSSRSSSASPYATPSCAM